MLKKVAIIITPNYKDYARKYLADCVRSVRAQDYSGEMKIFITDNETSEESYGYLRKILAAQNVETRRGASLRRFEIIRNKTNDGFAKGVNDSMRRALAQGFDYIAVVNIHTTVAPDYISELVKVIDNPSTPFVKGALKNPSTPPLLKGGVIEIGVIQARMMLDPHSASSGQAKKDRINSLGNVTHFLGFGYCSHYGEKWDENMELGSGHPEPSSGQLDEKKIVNRQSSIDIHDIHYPSGSSMFFKREVLEKVGLLDEEYWMYNEDQEIGWRIWLAGYRCVLAPNAVMYNKYEFQRSIKKFYWMDRNRINAILQCYRLPTLLLIFPAFVIMEIGLILFSLKGGWFKDKIRVWKYFLTPKTWAYVRRARKRNQSLRKIKDRDIVNMISGRIWYQEVGDVKLKLVNPVFDLYWRIARWMMVW